MKITKSTVKKSIRTFIQTVIGYVVTNLAMFVSGIDFTDKDVLKNALIGLAIAAISAGAAAVMNLEKSTESEE
jgi:hypothetical protein